MSEPGIGDPSRPANRLSITHLFLWTAASALAVAAVMPDQFPVPIPANLSAELRARANYQLHVWRITTVAMGPILGAGLAAIAIASWRRIRGRPGFPTLPGHWLLMLVGSCTLGAMLVRLVAWGGCLLPLIMLLVAMFHVLHPEHWKRVFTVAGLSVAAFFLFGLCCFPLGSTPLVLVILPAILLATPISVIVAAARDAKLGVGQDFFHWAGVFAVPALVAVFLVALIVS